MRLVRLSSLTHLARPSQKLTDHLLATEIAAAEGISLKGFFGMGIVASVCGKLRVRIHQSTYVVAEDSFMVINQGSLLELSAEEGTQPLFLLFKESTAQLVAAELFHRSTTADISLANLRNHELVEHIHYANASLQERLKLLLRLGDGSASFVQLKSDALVRSIIHDLSEKNLDALQYAARLPVQKKATRSNLYIRLAMARDWLAKSFREPVDMEAAAAVAMMSKAHFSRHFKAVYGQSPYQYLMSVRLSWAEAQIVNGEDSMQQIAESICFDTLSSFSHQFKKWKGVSPRQLRHSPLVKP